MNKISFKVVHNLHQNGTMVCNYMHKFEKKARVGTRAISFWFTLEFPSFTCTGMYDPSGKL